MAEINTKADLLAKGYKGYQGWGDAEAIADYRATGGQGKFDPGLGAGAPGAQGAPGGFQGAVQQAQQALAGARQPQIAGLEAQRPTTEQRFAGQREQLAGKEESMKTRYSNLLSDIKGREERETTTATRTQAQELAQRGIAPGSTFYQQEIQGAQRPISQVYGGLTRDIGLAQSEEAQQLAGLGQQLTVDEQQAQQDISQAIAALQSATNTQAVEVAMQQLAQAQQAQQFAQQQATTKYSTDVTATTAANRLAQEQAQYAQQWPYAQRQYEYDLGKPYYKPTDDGDGTFDFASLWEEFNQ